MSDLDPLVFVRLPGMETWVRPSKVVSVAGTKQTSTLYVEGRDPVTVAVPPDVVLSALDGPFGRVVVAAVDVEVDGG